MSTILVNVGQCGNQVGERLLQLFVNSYSENKKQYVNFEYFVIKNFY